MVRIGLIGYGASGVHYARVIAAEARASLALAREDFANGHKESATQEAIRASALADTAIGIAQRHKDDAIASAHEAQSANVEAARDRI